MTLSKKLINLNMFGLVVTLLGMYFFLGTENLWHSTIMWYSSSILWHNWHNLSWKGVFLGLFHLPHSTIRLWITFFRPTPHVWYAGREKIKTLDVLLLLERWAVMNNLHIIRHHLSLLSQCFLHAFLMAFSLKLYVGQPPIDSTWLLHSSWFLIDTNFLSTSSKT